MSAPASIQEPGAARPAAEAGDKIKPRAFAMEILEIHKECGMWRGRHIDWARAYLG